MEQLNNMNIKMRLKEGDEVKVIAGRDKGKIGKIKDLLRNKSMVIVDGINIKTKHYKTRQEQEKGQIKQIEFPIHISNIMFYDIEKQVVSKSIIHIKSSKINYLIL
uniref:ribosomal protein L24 n=1 Tax=Dixoniella grisea TaxID=35153 RepID=UPI001FCE1986|nr:ribosomal protein L24 [Dixoniella grisea]UNJ17163.1 ribosomal protein L24 [Dixoniella grisea]